MNMTIFKGAESFKINLLPFTQICGLNFEKKQFILNSICKYFSSSKYMLYEQNMIDNILIDGEQVGRKYFSVIRIQSREDILSMIQLSKNSILMKYLEVCFNDFNCQTILNRISDELEQLYLQVNTEFFSSMSNLIMGFEVNDILKIIQNSTVQGKGERDLHELSDYELLQMLFQLIEEINRKMPEKRLVIIENIDHLISYKDYVSIISFIKNIINENDIWFLFSMSVEGYVFLDETVIEGVNVINTVIFTLPEFEVLEDFLFRNYPRQIKINTEELMEMLRGCVHQIGNEEYTITLRNNILLKLINDSLCITSKRIDTINSLEIAFLNQENML